MMDRISRILRRLLWIPLFLLATVALLTSLPLWLLAAGFASRFVPGRWRILRTAWFLFVYLLFDCITIIGYFGLWVVSGFGWKLSSPRFQDYHYRLAGWWLRRVVGSARRTFNLTFRPDDPTDRRGEADDRAPLLLFSRHAGPGDSVLLVDAALNTIGRRPRVILKDVLQLEPVVDLALNRLPNHFVPSVGRAGRSTVDAIYELCADMGPEDCLILFPEGGNFTPHRRERAVEHLENSGRPGLAAQARAMEHVLPPKPTGALTAIEAAPTATVAFVGHVGLEQLSSIRGIWQGTPMDTSIITRVWLVPADEVPPPAGREQWLYDHWAELDAWIDATIAEEAMDG